MFDPKDEIELPYPTIRDVHLIDTAAALPRNLVVRRVRDLCRQPLTPAEFMRRPYINRSRWLITAHDADIREFRQFYLGSSPRFRSPGCLRIALERDGHRQLIARQFEPTIRDRRVMMRMIQRISDQSPDLVQFLRIIADDMRLVR